MSLHNFNSNTKSWKMYTNTLTSISGDDLLVMPSYGKDLILEVSANNDIFFKKGTITKRFDNLVSDYLETSFNYLNSRVQYILQEISGSSVKDFITSGISNDLLIKSYEGRDIILEVSGNSEIIFKRGDISYNLDDLIGGGGGGGGGGTQSSDYATYNILDITGKIIFTDNSNVQRYNDASLNNVDISGSLKVAGTISASNIYTKTEIDASFTNVYTKSQLYTKTEIDASFTNVYTKSQLYTKSQVDASLANIYTNSLDVSGNVTIRGSTLYVPSSFTIDPIGHGDNTGTVLINGNLVVQGVTTTINSSVVDISDKMIVLASNAANSLQADGAGFEISGAKVNFLYNNSSATFRSSIGIGISGNVIPLANGSIGETGKNWSNAYIRDISATNIDVSGNIVPLLDAGSNLGSSFKRWRNIFVNDLSVNTINGQAYKAFGGDVYTKTEVDVSFSNVYTKLSIIDSSLVNVYTRGQVDVSFVSKQLFDASLSSIQLSNVYTKNQVDVSFVSKQLFEASYNVLAASSGGGSGGYIQNNENISFDILNITDTIIFTDSSNVELYNDASFNNVDVSGSLNVAGTISASNIYTKSQVDVSFVSKQLFDASLSSIQLTNVYTKNQVDVSFISKQYFEASYNVLVSSIGTSGGTSTGTATTSTIAKKFYNQDWNLRGTNITTVKDISGANPLIMSTSLDGYTIMVYWAGSSILYPTGVGSQEQRKGSIAVYTFTSNSWIQKGETILLPFTYIPPWRYAESGGADGDATGLPIDIVRFNGKYMSGDGNIIAIPLSRATYGPNTGDYLNPTVTHNVYSFNGITWIQIASETIEPDAQYYTTYSFENNIIKRFVNDGGTKVTIHTLTNGSFVQDSAQISETDVNTSINVTGSGDFWSRRARGISGDGKVVIFTKEKSIVLFKYNGTIWQQYGNVTLITIPTWFNNFVKLSHDGSVFLAVGWDTTVNGDIYAGMAKIYAYNSSSNTWIQRGQDIVYEEVTFVDEAQGVQYGSDTKILSGDGLTIALGGRNRPWVLINDGGYYNGYLQAYRYSSVTNYWSKIGRELTGVPDERPGQYITSSYNGNVIHVDGGGFKETPTSVNTGRIRVFEIEVDASFSSLTSSSSSSSNAYSKTEIDASFANVYTKSQVDASFTNIYTKSQVDASFANIYTKSQIDVSFVSKQLFDASINALAVSGGGSSSTQYDNNIKILPDWVPIVEISNNLYTNLGYGDQVVFSKDGSTVATNAYEYIVPETTAKVGTAFIYHYNGTSWVQKGQPIDGKFNNFGFPIAMSLSSNGNVIALGYHKVYRHHDSLGVGVVIIYNYNMTTLLWEQLGNDIFSGRREEDIRHPPYMNFYGFANMGESLALSGDGTIIAIGAPNSSSMADYYNGVVVYKYETRNSVLDWYETSVILFVNFQIDIDIFGSYDVGHPNNFVYENFGKTIALSSDGTVIAVASPNEPKNEFPLILDEPYHAGVVRTFKWNGIYWINTGRIVGEYEWDGDGEPNNSISLSANGNILAIGSLKNSARSSYNGSVRVYLWNNTDNSWNKLGDTFYGQGGVYGDGNGSRIGNSVSLSDDGTIIAISSGSGSDITGVFEYKHGRVYKWDGTSWNRIGNAFHQGNTIALSGDGNYVAVANGGNAIETISIYDLQQNNIISINLTNLFFLDGSTYSYRKNDIKNSIFQINENSVHSEYYSDFPNKFTRTLYISQNGSLYNRNNTYGAISDVRLKENIVDATPKLEDLLKVRVVNYNLIGSTNKHIGVIAQELEEIFPGLVVTDTSGQKYKSVKYSCMNIMLVKALQEQQVLINDMSSNINTLKDEITTLKQNMNSLLTRIQALEPNANQ